MALSQAACRYGSPRVMTKSRQAVWLRVLRNPLEVMMFEALGNAIKAVAAVAVAPVDVLVDVVTLPVTSSNGDAPFKRTEHRLTQASRALDAALEPSKD
ncbi:hypothetical protein [Cupriavidus gilardii]|uniref:hypothetical protein n=1 Tax=Cupriavidus gilardii TaxID=82541 RepID=UPI0021B306BE|nr:hypothetical protein [Cupriavidus gilardii]UXC34792.1 hypothetical protein N4G38_10095 [Cupriavidus gilardii]